MPGLAVAGKLTQWQIPVIHRHINTFVYLFIMRFHCFTTGLFTRCQYVKYHEAIEV